MKNGNIVRWLASGAANVMGGIVKGVCNGVKQAIEEHRDSGVFKTIRPCTFEEMLQDCDIAYIAFIHNHCMKKLEDRNGEGVQTISDSDNILVAKSESAPDMTVECAKKIGLILPNNTDPNSVIRPFVITFYGVGAGRTLNQLSLAIKNVFNVESGAIGLIYALVMSFIESEQKRLSDGSNVVVVPMLAGFSMGGLLANTIGVKENIASVTFNPLGLGREARNFVGADKFDLANGEKAKNHMSFFVDFDFVSSENMPPAAMTATPGQKVRLPNDNPANPIKTHREYETAFTKALMNGQTTTPRLPQAN
ncbi:MAG: hypothetical protein LBR91_02380 [Puniceicoccales bacterium]|jgi:hypothetical protein|nr:hypothetical protein [Puniceicoccales bacterium]